MSWWAWAAAALILAGAEMAFGTWILLGFAVGAGMMALNGLLGWPFVFTTIPVALAVWAAISLGAWLVLRSMLGVREGQVTTFDKDVNDD